MRGVVERFDILLVSRESSVGVFDVLVRCLEEDNVHVSGWLLLRVLTRRSLADGFYVCTFFTNFGMKERAAFYYWFGCWEQVK